MSIQTIAVLGAGTMGNGIAHVAALGGYQVLLQDVVEEAHRRALATIESNLRKGVERGKLTDADARAALERVRTTADLERCGREADLVIEAVPERIELKLQVYATLDRAAPAHTIFASNTSALSITEMAAATRRPRRFIGMHFFNPVHVMKLVEVVRGLETDDATLGATVEVAQRMGKETVEVRESPGFVTSRINALIGNEAFRMLQEGVASARDIDKALKLGLNHPMGPFEMADLVGLDTRLSILRYLHQTLGDAYRPNLLLEQMVKAGRLGKKVGRGVYDYPEAAPRS
ncbi:MAG: 3-hydroxyacyl-CoA dehydrogenase [Planctomycetes bacterium]|nr:3-hydroxyacyl-CoA dehydrogenase [Planctomycetota bacterium]